MRRCRKIVVPSLRRRLVVRTGSHRFCSSRSLLRYVVRALWAEIVITRQHKPMVHRGRVRFRCTPVGRTGQSVVWCLHRSAPSALEWLGDFEIFFHVPVVFETSTSGLCEKRRKHKTVRRNHSVLIYKWQSPPEQGGRPRAANQLWVIDVFRITTATFEFLSEIPTRHLRHLHRIW